MTEESEELEYDKPVYTEASLLMLSKVYYISKIYANKH